MKNPIIVILLLLVCNISFAQEEQKEWTTYFAENAIYQVDFPDQWGVGVAEEKALLGWSMNITGIDTETPGSIVVITSTLGCARAKKEAKSYLSIFERNAKKSKDSEFQILSEGESEDYSGKDVYYIDFKRTFNYDDGSTGIIRELFYARCYKIGLNRYANITRMQAPIGRWEDYGNLYKDIFKKSKFME